MEKGFTLAETLITLGIIGVVAAMTIPTVVSKFQEKVLKSQFKATYSLLNQALRLTNYESGTDYYKCYSLQGTENGNTYYIYDECKEFYKSFFSHLKQIEWEKGNKVYPIPYKNKTEVLAEGGDVTNSACSFGYVAPIERYTLSNGSRLYLSDTNSSSHMNLFMTVDINGEKGPNKWGYVFYLSPTKRANGSLRIDEAICVMWEKGGKRAANMLYDIDEVSKGWFIY